LLKGIDRHLDLTDLRHPLRTAASGGLRPYKYRLGTPASRVIPDLLGQHCRRPESVE
jgi:hypothetical protein